MSNFNVGDRRSNLMHKLVYVGGSNPWRECDADGWIAHDGKGAPDFGACTSIDARQRGQPGQISDWTVVDAADCAPLWITDADMPDYSADIVAWRPAAPSPSHGLTPEAVRGVLRWEQPKAVPTESVSNINHGHMEKAEEPAKCCCGEPERAGSVHRTDGPCYREEPAKEETRLPEPYDGPQGNHNWPMYRRDEREESDRERAYREGVKPIRWTKEGGARMHVKVEAKRHAEAVAAQALTLTPMDGRAGSWRAS